MRVVIVGGGIMGCATAFYLKKKGIDAVVVEQCGVACHSSGKAAGFLALDWNSGAVGDLSRVSFGLHQELASELGAEAIGYRRMSCLGVGFGGIHQKDSRAWLDRTSAGASEMGTAATVAQVHPRKLTERLLAASGAELVIARATGLLRTGEGGAVVGVTTAGGGDVAGDAVVLATGAWMSKAADWFEPPLPVLARTVGHKYTSVTWECVEADSTAVFLEVRRHARCVCV